jgi:endonuclease/exonuclease/phosphatase family metal-dependent hydrolase
MAGRWRLSRWGWPVAAACLLALLTLGTEAAPAGDGPSGAAVRVLQMNLCNSGIARCYTGRSVAEAAAVIAAERPDIVTLNEVCHNDIAVLAREVSSASSARVADAFAAAVDRRTGRPVRCRNGQRYGIGLLAVLRAPYARTTRTGRYPAQDAADPEERVWLCLHSSGNFVACTTHLADGSAAVALRQCRYLFSAAVAPIEGSGDPLILGADLNLEQGMTPDLRSCVPSDFARTGDGGRQYIVASPGVMIRSSETIDMHGTTDHPGLLAGLTITARASSG